MTSEILNHEEPKLLCEIDLKKNNYIVQTNSKRLGCCFLCILGWILTIISIILFGDCIKHLFF
jgi:hypothetical protein